MFYVGHSQQVGLMAGHVWRPHLAEDDPSARSCSGFKGLRLDVSFHSSAFFSFGPKESKRETIQGCFGMG